MPHVAPSELDQDLDAEAQLQLHEVSHDACVLFLLRLSVRERGRCACVSRAWRVLLALPAAWCELDVRGVELSSQQLLELATRAGGGLRVLRLSEGLVPPNLALDVARSNPSLRELSVDASEEAPEAAGAPTAWRPDDVAALHSVPRLAAALSVASMEGVEPLLAADRLATLRVERAQLDAEGCLLLVEAALQAASLSLLSLRWNSVGAKGCRSLARLTQLHALLLGWNDVGDEGAAALAGALRESRLTELDLRHCGVGRVGCRSLALALSGSRLTRLCLLHNHVGPAGAQMLAAALQSRDCALVHLDLSFNDIGARGAAAFTAQALRRLLSLRLAFNSLCVDAARTLAAALAHNSSLLELDLGYNALSDEGCRELCVSLRSHPTLQTLALPVTAVGPEGARRLGGLLRHCASLCRLDVSGNALGRAGIVALAHGLEGGGGAMRQLNLCATHADDTAAHALARALRSPGGAGLARLLLDVNAIGDDGARELAAACRLPRAALRHLSLQGNFLVATDTGAAALHAAASASAGRLEVLGLPSR